jgi:Inner membrane component of T3SS, cytoplasmic domain/Inner membrane component of T3SS, periplasmic domain
MEANAVTPSTAPQQELQESAAPMRRKATRLKLEVVAGAHQGAVLMLDRTDYRIGSSPNADIVLSDSGVAPDHAALRVERGAVRIGATGADVMVEQEPLSLSRGRRVKLPVSFTLGAAQIHLCDPDHADPGRRSGEFGRWVIHNPLTAAGVLACFVLAVTVVAQELPRTVRTVDAAVTTGPSDAGALAHLTNGLAAGSSTANSDRQSVATVEDAARELSTRLDLANIKTLRVSAVDGRLAVAGQVRQQEALGWAAIQQWFDQTYGDRIVLTTKINTTGETRTMPALQLEAIWYGERPYIVTADGERYFQGAVLDNGWVIRDIGEDRLLLAKDGETVALTYR